MCLNQKSGKKAQVSLSKQRTLSRHLQIYAQIAVMFAVCMLKRRVRVNSSWRKSAFWHSCVPFQVLFCKWGFKGVIYIMLKRRGKHFTRCITKSFLKSYCPSDRTLNGAPCQDNDSIGTKKTVWESWDFEEEKAHDDRQGNFKFFWLITIYKYTKSPSLYGWNIGDIA